MLPGILNSFEQFQNASTGLKLSYYAISYKPFLGLFNMTGIVNDGQVPEAIGTPLWTRLLLHPDTHAPHS